MYVYIYIYIYYTLLNHMNSFREASRVLIADQEGDLWVFNVKNRRECKAC